MKILIVLALAGASLLAACTPASPGGTPAANTAILSEAQSDAVAACGFLPTVATVAGILAAGNPAVMTAAAIGQAICAAVVPAKAAGPRRAAAGASAPAVSGVAIEGHFVD